MSAIEITTKVGCKNACIFCPQQDFINAYTKKSNVLLMSFNDFKTCIDKIQSDVHIYFSGMCEPWLNPECTKMLLYAHNKGHKIRVYTTLVGMTSSDVELMESIPFIGFVVHLPSNGDYEKIQVDGYYLDTLNRILESKINFTLHIHGEELSSKVNLIKNNEIKLEKKPLYSRSGNVSIKNRHNLFRKRGTIACKRNLRYNVLLPNGDVILCCMDYKIKHILGNLISSDYEALFKGEEFVKIEKGLKKESLDIICRNCDWLTYHVDLTAKIINFPYILDHYFYHLRNVKNLNDISHFMNKTFGVLKRILHVKLPRS